MANETETTTTTASETEREAVPDFLPKSNTLMWTLIVVGGLAVIYVGYLAYQRRWIVLERNIIDTTARVVPIKEEEKNDEAEWKETADEATGI